ncbi:MAG: glutaredoxin 3, partial [Proteobacteria bacterium]|nr:glutaredoxin 3 [Pseudomonadota bacterium]
MATVTIYTTMFCPFCSRAKSLLGTKGVEYEEIAVDLDAAKRAEMVARTKGGSTVPQIFINDMHIGGSDELADLERAGRLDQLLSVAP